MMLKTQSARSPRTAIDGRLGERGASSGVIGVVDEIAGCGVFDGDVLDDGRSGDGLNGLMVLVTETTPRILTNDHPHA